MVHVKHAEVSNAVLMRCGTANGITLKRAKDMSDFTNVSWQSLNAVCACVCVWLKLDRRSGRAVAVRLQFKVL